MINDLDVPLRQVLIEARIVEAKDTFGRALGVKLGATDLRSRQGGEGGYSLGGDTRVAIGNGYADAVATSGAGGSVNLSGNFVNLPANPTVGQAATFGVSIFSAAANRFLNLELSALESDGQGKVISSPRIITANLQSAVIEQGEELPYQVATSSGATSVAFKKINLRLEVKPQITPEGNVLLSLDVNKDTVGRSTPAGYGLDTKHVQTQVMVENGGTVVIGGIFYLTETNEELKVPFLGDLPGVGNLFKNKSRSTTKTELLIFVTPKMIADATAR
jgi:type IV pilus assembly protein PilQ